MLHTMLIIFLILGCLLILAGLVCLIIFMIDWWRNNLGPCQWCSDPGPDISKRYDQIVIRSRLPVFNFCYSCGRRQEGAK